MVRIQNWTLSKSIALVLVGGYAMMLFDIRSEHVDVVLHNWKAWIPIYYSITMLLVGSAAVARWERGGRQVLLVAFCTSLIVGALGFWFHSHGQPISAITTVLGAWTEPLHHKDAPPALAPLSFAGLGLLGVLACARRSQP